MPSAHACIIASVAAFVLLALPGYGAQPHTGSTTLRPPVPIDSRAMNAMLRADRDKDGTLSFEELEQYDMTLAPRFREADADRDGRLTLYEFETLLGAPPTATTQR